MYRVLEALAFVLAIALVFTAGTEAGPPNSQAILKYWISEGQFADPSGNLRAFYEPRAYEPAWVRGRAPTTQALALIQAFQASGAKGLNPDDYDAAQWNDRLAQLRTQPSEADAATFDLKVTLAALRFVSHLHAGRVDPDLLNYSFGSAQEGRDPAMVARTRLVNAEDVGGVLDGIEPSFPGYQRTRAALQKYSQLAASGDMPRLSATHRTVDPGSVYPEAQKLARILVMLGDLPPHAVVQENHYSGDLVIALKHFQTRHALPANGRITPETFRELNTPLSKRVSQLRLTLERYRMVSHRYRAPAIVVNIPEFRLRAFDSSHGTALEMKVIVGKAYRNPTPVFASDMTSVIFRPYWEVPPGIQRNELAPKARRDRSYLSRHGFQVVSARNAGGVRFRQVPGPHNALGLVKFVFPNKYNVYMHGTPAAGLFSRSRRDFSHGCIRLERPEALAAWVLRNRPEWTPARIAAAMHGNQTITVRLDRQIPVLIVYATAVVEENGDVYFFNDIYGHDSALDQLLSTGYPYPVASVAGGGGKATP